MGDALFGHAGKVVHPAHCIEGSDGIHSQGVDRALNQQLAYGLAGLLEGSDRTIFQGHFQQFAVHVHLPWGKPQVGDFPIDVADGKSRGHSLSDNCSYR